MIEATLISANSQLSRELGDVLSKQGIEVTEVRQEKTEIFALQYNPSLPASKLGFLRRLLRPLEPDCVRDETLAAGQIRLCFGDGRALAGLKITIASDASELCEGLCEELVAAGFGRPQLRAAVQAYDVIEHGGASAYALQLLLWHLGRSGIDPLLKQAYEPGDPRITIRLADPAKRGLPLGERCPVEVLTDCPETGLAIRPRLLADGFQQVRITVADGRRKRPSSKEILVDPGPLRPLGATVEEAKLVALTGQAAHEAGIDLSRYPVRLAEDPSETASLCLPFRACREGRLRPYAGSYFERFSVHIRSDDRADGMRLRKDLLAEGFAEVSRRALSDDSCGFEIIYGAAAHGRILERARELVELFMAEIGADGVSLAMLHRLSDRDTGIHIHVPSRAFRSGELLRRDANPAYYQAWIRGGGAAAARALSAIFTDWGFAKLELQPAGDDQAPQILYGGADQSLLERIGAAVEKVTGVRLPTKKVWAITSRKIAVVLPSEPALPGLRGSAAPGRRTDTRRRRGRATRPLLEVGDDRLDLAGHSLPRRPDSQAPGVPQLSFFRGYCLDEITGETLLHLVQSIELGEPCLLLGPTSTSKSSAILYLCAWLNRPVFRLNLNGMTESGELVGRYVPEGAEGWRFNEGLLVRAMREGHFVILDEANLAESQALERLNSVLEEHPSLILSEHDHSAVEPVHPEFHLFATCNPPSGPYVGRQPMSPALKDRFQSTRVTPLPGEREYLAQARLSDPRRAAGGGRPGRGLLWLLGVARPAAPGRRARHRDLSQGLRALPGRLRGGRRGRRCDCTESWGPRAARPMSFPGAASSTACATWTGGSPARPAARPRRPQPGRPWSATSQPR